MHPNEELVRRLYESLATNDMAVIDGCFAEDVVWHAPGRATNAGVRRGKQELFTAMGTLADLTGGSLRAEIHDVLASDDHAVVLQTTLGEREGRRPLADAEVIVFHVREDTIAEVWEHPGDLYAVEAFFE